MYTHICYHRDLNPFPHTSNFQNVMSKENQSKILQKKGHVKSTVNAPKHVN